MKINFNNLLYLPMILFFFPAFAIAIPGLVSLKIQFIILCIYCFFLLLTAPKKIFDRIYSVHKNTPFKILLFILMFIIINTLFLSLIGIEKFSLALSSIIMQIFLGIGIVLFYYIGILDNYISYKKYIRFFLLMIYIILIIGIISWFGMFFEIELINNIFDFLANARILNLSRTGYDLFRQTSNYYAFNLPRLDNLYEEPGWYARFILIFMPMIYCFAFSKFKICKNKFVNILLKKTIVPLSWISLILTFSPIFLILAIVLTIILYIKNFIKYFNYLFVPMLGLLILMFIIISTVDFSETYLSRIMNVFTQIKSFEDFIIVEGSLATRIVSYVNSCCIFKDHFSTGVGLGNIGNYMINQLEHSPLPLTQEIQTKLNFSYAYNVPYSTNIGFIYNFLAEHGIIITSMWIFFVYKLYWYIDIISKYFQKQSYFYFEKYISVSLKGCLISIILLSFYENYFTMPEMYLVFVLILILIYRFKKIINKKGDLI